MSDDPDGDHDDSIVGVGGEADKKREGCFLRSSRSVALWRWRIGHASEESAKSLCYKGEHVDMMSANFEFIKPPLPCVVSFWGSPSPP